jgi:hypothetical protein
VGRLDLRGERSVIAVAPSREYQTSSGVIAANARIALR